MSDLRLIDDALDAARVVDDFVRGVIGLGDGRLGGIDERTPSWSQRLFGRSSFTNESGHAGALAAAYGPEQLRKAANAADEMVPAMAALSTGAGTTVLAAHIDVLEAGVEQVPATLRDRDVTARSPRLREVHATLSRVIGILTEARARVLLAEMRARPTDQA